MRKGDSGSYLYWSSRRIAEIASDNGINLGGRLNWAVKVAPQGVGAELTSRERGDLTRLEKARKLEKAIGARAVSTFESPPPARFAKGVGRVHVARFIGGPERDQGAMFHIRTSATTNQQVDLVLFGSMENFPGRILSPSDAPEEGWYSSAWYAIADLLESRGARNESQWDDLESLSVEALNIAVNQGSLGSSVEHDDQPWTRGYTLAHADSCEWFAQVYTDVVLTKERWALAGNLAGTERILVGAPAWIRTANLASVTRYGQLPGRTAASTPRRRLR